MSNILSNSELNSFQVGMQDHYDQFSQFHNLIVYKKPQQQVLDMNNNNSLYGYGQENSNPDNITYISNSGVFKCVGISKDTKNKDNVIEFLPAYIVNSQKIIKTDAQIKNFLENGIENERLVLDNETFIKVSSSYSKAYGALTFYYFGLNQTS